MLASVNSYVTYAQSSGEEIGVSFDVKSHLSGRELISFIERKGLQYCRYNDQGSGCWTCGLNLISELAKSHYLKKNAKTEVEREVDSFRSNRTDFWIPLEDGARLVTIGDA